MNLSRFHLCASVFAVAFAPSFVAAQTPPASAALGLIAQALKAHIGEEGKTYRVRAENEVSYSKYLSPEESTYYDFHGHRPCAPAIQSLRTPRPFPAVTANSFFSPPPPPESSPSLPSPKPSRAPIVPSRYRPGSALAVSVGRSLDGHAQHQWAAL